MYRTHTCGALRIENVNENVCLSGWVQKIRNLGAMTFIDLRDRYGIKNNQNLLWRYFYGKKTQVYG